SGDVVTWGCLSISLRTPYALYWRCLLASWKFTYRMKGDSMQKRISTAITSCLLAAGLASGAAMAQQAAPNANLPATTVPAPDYSDAQLERFVSASQKVVMISQEYTP